MEDVELAKNISEPVETPKIKNIDGDEEIVKNITEPVQPTKNIDEKEPLETNAKTVVNEGNDKESKNVSSLSDFEAKLEFKISDMLEKNENQTLAKIDELLEKNVSVSIDFNDLKFDNKNEVLEKNESDSVSKLVVKISDMLEKNENKTLVKELLQKNESVSKNQMTIADPETFKFEENDLAQDIVTKSNPKTDSKNQVVDNKELGNTLANKVAKSNPEAKYSETEFDAILKQNTLKVEIPEPKVSPTLDSDDGTEEAKPKIDPIDIEKSIMNNSQSQTPEENYRVMPKSDLSDYKNISILEPTQIENQESLVVKNHFLIIILVVLVVIVPFIIGTIVFFCCKKSKKENQSIELGNLGNGNEEKAEDSNTTTESEL